MNAEYVIQLLNPTPRHRTMKILRGKPLNGDRSIRSTQDVSMRLPPYSWRNVLFDSNGNPHSSMIRSVDDIGIEEDLSSNGTISFDNNRTTRIRVDGVDVSGMAGDLASREKFTSAASRVYANLFHDPDHYLGGRMVMTQNSFLRSQRDGKPGLYSPAALNLTVEERPDSLYQNVKSGYLEILECVGDGYNSDDALQLRISNNSPERVRFCIPKGAMFEQSEWTGNQNLVVPEEQWYEIGPGEEQSFPVPAMCANATGGSPSRDRMNLTPFLFNDLGESFSSQDRFWCFSDGANRNARL